MALKFPRHTLRKSQLFCLAGIFLLSIFSCQKETPEPNENISNQVNFNNPLIGQKSEYVLLLGENIKDKNNQNFEYKQDTLSIEVIEKIENGFILEEKLTDFSASLNGENNVAFPSFSIQLLLKTEDQQITIQSLHSRIKSRLFHLNEDDALQMELLNDLRLEMESWKTNLPFQPINQTGYLSNYSLFTQTYSRLNVIINNFPMQDELSGYTHVYSPEYGLVRSSSYSPHNGKGFGWDLLPSD